MTVDIARTRTSDRWAGRRPGNWDRLHTGMLMPSDNELGIPSLLPAGPQDIPKEWVSWTSRDHCALDALSRATTSRAAWHFFLDDYRFETAWNRPEWATRRVQLLGSTLTPDFSLWPEMPLVMQEWQVYRGRWLGALWQRAGYTVIPSISWAARKSWGFAFLGISSGSVVAVSTVGIVRRREYHPAFLAGYDAMMEAINPAAVVCYGRIISGMTGDVREYPTRWRS